MKKESIVLITGAGASHDFDSNMELGNSLIRNIKNRVYEQEDEYLSIVVKSIGFDDRLRKEFQTNLSKYINACEKNKSEASIDSFINQYPKFKNLAKTMIALHILGYEQQCEKNASFKKHSWLSKFVIFIKNYDVCSPILSSSIDLKIITFNYDRLIEEFLFREFGQKIETFVNENIYHVYNKLAYLPWQHQKLKEIADENHLLIRNGDKPKPLPFIHFGHPNYDAIRIEERKEDILLIYEEKKDIELKKIIEQANRIYFMGFAFDSENMRLLGFPNLLNGNNSPRKIFTNHYIGDITNNSIYNLNKEIKRISKEYFLNKNISISDSCSGFIGKYFT